MASRPEEVRRVLEFVRRTPAEVDTGAKYAALHALTVYFSGLSAEERGVFPAEVVDDLRCEERRMALFHLAKEGEIDALKALVNETLEVALHGSDSPYLRAGLGNVAAVACCFLVVNLPEDQRELWVRRGLEGAEAAVELFGSVGDLEGLCDALEARDQLLTHNDSRRK